MEEFGIILTFCLIIALAFVGGCCAGSNLQSSAYKERLHNAGIEEIVFCNNSISNWIEIVYLDVKAKK